MRMLTYADICWRMLIGLMLEQGERRGLRESPDLHLQALSLPQKVSIFSKPPPAFPLLFSYYSSSTFNTISLLLSRLFFFLRLSLPLKLFSLFASLLFALFLHIVFKHDRLQLAFFKKKHVVE